MVCDYFKKNNFLFDRIFLKDLIMNFFKMIFYSQFKYFFLIEIGILVENKFFCFFFMD